MYIFHNTNYYVYICINKELWLKQWHLIEKLCLVKN